METKCDECNGTGFVKMLWLADRYEKACTCPKCEGYGTLLPHMIDGSDDE